MSRSVPLTLLAVALAACSAAAPAADVAVTTVTTVTTTTTATTSTVVATTSTTRPTGWTAARARGPLPVFDRPRGEEPVRSLDPTTVLGTPSVVLVREMRRDGWLRVLLPGRPNGAEGWVRAADVDLFTGKGEIVVTLGTLTLEVVVDGETVLTTPVAIGKPASPTPTGLFFVTDAVRVTSPDGPWGPFALGLSARSNTITEFGGADGIIAIHGTSRPDSIGTAGSLGCVRVPNETILRIGELVSVGAPVLIKA